MRRTSPGEPSKYSRSFSKISTASKPAALMAASLSVSVPLMETVAMERHGCARAAVWGWFGMSVAMKNLGEQRALCSAGVP